MSISKMGRLVSTGEIDTVVVAFTDMQGRLQGKSFAARFFLNGALRRGAEGCNYLLAVDVDLSMVDAYAMWSWDSSYGDSVMRCDTTTLPAPPGVPP